MTGRPPGKHPDHRELIEAAQRCFLRSGFAAATMREIAEEAGTSTSRLYVAFDGKHEMFVAVMSAANTKLVEDYLRPAVTQPGPPWDRVMALTEAYLRFYIEERDLATLMATTMFDADDPHPAMVELVESQQSQLQLAFSVVRELTDDSGSDLDAAHVVRWAWASVSGLVSINMRLPHLAVDDDELDRIVGLGLRFVRAGLRESGKLAPAPPPADL